MAKMTCEECQKEYSVPPCRTKNSRFCSNSCRVEASRSPRASLKCQNCGVNFSAKQDHGAWPKFCGRQCFLSHGSHLDQLEKVCDACGGVFLTPVKQQKFCCVACRMDGLKKGEESTCLNCGKPFYASPSRSGQACCSPKCSRDFFIGAMAPGFKTGSYTHTQMGEKHVLLPRPGFISKYVGEHRIIAARLIGRPLERGEYVLRVNRNPQDNSPDNLFLCDAREFCKRRNGSLPWPTVGNLLRISVLMP